jgi:uncharacterized damage-inducible protein DinB
MELIPAFPQYLVWANRRAAQMVRTTATDSGLAIFSHLLAAETIWVDRLEGKLASATLRPTWSIEECEALIEPNAQRFERFNVASEGEAIIDYKTTRGEPFRSTIAEIVLHVFAHGSYHRGQISQQIAASGGEIIDTDYILFRR